MERREFNPDLEKEQSKANFADLVMSAKEYAEIEDIEFPYRYELKGGNKELVYLGFSHSADPENPAFKTIVQDMETFKPDVVMVEGMAQINNESQEQLKEYAKISPSDEELIQKHGENAYTAKLAIDRDIRVVSPEPSEKDKVDFILEKGLAKDAIFGEAMVTVLHQYNWLENKPDLNEYINNYLGRFKEEFGWQDFDFSLENFKNIYKEFTHREFNINDKDVIGYLNDPIPRGVYEYTDINKAAAMSSLYRDRYMVNQIQKEFENNDKIYIVFGGSHAIMQESALRKLMESYEEK